jgi:hypothetical protein
MFVPWYKAYNGLTHGCLYCRSCGAVHDTIGYFFLLGIIKLLLKRIPSKVTAAYEFPEIKRLTRINNPNCPSLHSMNPYIIEAMIEDNRLTEDEDLLAEPTIDFLFECSKDKHPIVRNEAMIALQRFRGEPRVDLFFKQLESEGI